MTKDNSNQKPCDDSPEEKSLLSLIQERNLRGSSSTQEDSRDFTRQIPETVSEGVGGDSEIDHYRKVMRLGGHGF